MKDKKRKKCSKYFLFMDLSTQKILSKLHTQNKNKISSKQQKKNYKILQMDINCKLQKYKRKLMTLI